MAVVDKYIIDVKTQGAKKANTQMTKLSASGKKLGASLGAAAVAYFGTQGLISAINGSIAAYQQQEMAERKLQTALGRTSQALLSQASALQKVTTFGDEAIIAQQAFLGSIGFTEDKIKQLIPVALDLASATGQTLEFAVRNLAKTYSGLTGELGELIPQTKELTAEELKAGGALQVISDLMGGSAEQNTQTMTGSLQQMTNAVGDTAESIGKFLSPSIISGSRVLQSMAESLTNAIDNFDRFMHGGSNVVGILSQLEMQSIKFNEQLQATGDDEEKLLELGKQIEAQRDKEMNSVGLATDTLLMYEEQLKQIVERLEELSIKEGETSEFRRNDAQLNHDTIIGLKEQEISKIDEMEGEALRKYKLRQAQILQTRLGTVSGLAGALSSLAGQHKQGAKVAKRFAQIQATIDTYAAANTALKAYPPPFGAIAMAAVIAQGIANVAQIENQKFQTGGMVGGRRHSEGGTIM